VRKRNRGGTDLRAVAMAGCDGGAPPCARAARQG